MKTFKMLAVSAINIALTAGRPGSERRGRFDLEKVRTLQCRFPGNLQRPLGMGNCVGRGGRFGRQRHEDRVGSEKECEDHVGSEKECEMGLNLSVCWPEM